MTKLLNTILFSACCVLAMEAAAQTPLRLWYNKPAEQWIEALPLGNGRLDAMFFGNLYYKRIQQNEITVWGCAPCRTDNQDAPEALSKVRQLIYEGNYKKAQDLANEKIISKVARGMHCQTVGNLHLSFPGHENYSDYYYDLDLEKALATTTYKVGDVTYEREVVSSFSYQVIIVHITTDKPSKIDFAASMDRQPTTILIME